MANYYKVLNDGNLASGKKVSKGDLIVSTHEQVGTVDVEIISKETYINLRQEKKSSTINPGLTESEDKKAGLEKLKVSELEKLAAEAGLEFTTKPKKAELIDALLNN